MKVQRWLCRELGMPPETEMRQITRAELEELYPSADDYGQRMIEVFLVERSGEEPVVLAYLPDTQTWETLNYVRDGSPENYWSQVGSS